MGKGPVFLVDVQFPAFHHSKNNLGKRNIEKRWNMYPLRVVPVINHDWPVRRPQGALWCLSIHAVAAAITRVVAQPNPIESLLGPTWLIKVKQMTLATSSSIFSRLGRSCGQAIEHPILWMVRCNGKGEYQFSKFVPTLLCIKGSSLTKHSCIRLTAKPSPSTQHRLYFEMPDLDVPIYKPLTWIPANSGPTKSPCAAPNDFPKIMQVELRSPASNVVCSIAVNHDCRCQSNNYDS